MNQGATSYRIVTDHLGSVVLAVDVSNGAIVERKSYDAWGALEVDTQPGTQPFGFGGGLEDPGTGLVRFGARDYDPQVGRWSARDPIGFAGGQTNLFAYVRNDPVKKLDPVGLDVYLGLYQGPGGVGRNPGAGHLGIGVGSPTTYGLYPNASILDQFTNLILQPGDVPGQIVEDDPGRLIGLLVIRTTSAAQDSAVQRAIEHARRRPPRYRLVGEHCGDFARDVLLEIGIDIGTDLIPVDQFNRAVEQTVERQVNAK
jgi:RHS repeat-associated protein